MLFALSSLAGKRKRGKFEAILTLGGIRIVGKRLPGEAILVEQKAHRVADHKGN